MSYMKSRYERATSPPTRPSRFSSTSSSLYTTSSYHPTSPRISGKSTSGYTATDLYPSPSLLRSTSRYSSSTSATSLPFRPHFSVLDLKPTSTSSWRSRQESRAKSPEKTEQSSPVTVSRKSNAEKKDPTPNASWALQSDSRARPGITSSKTLGDTKSTGNATSTVSPLLGKKSFSRTDTGSTLTELSPKKVETPPPGARTRKRSGEGSKEISSDNTAEAVKSVQKGGPNDKKAIDSDSKIKCDKKSIECTPSKQVLSKDSKHKTPNEKGKKEQFNSDKENTKGLENGAQKRDVKEDVDNQRNNRNKFISNPLRRSLKSRRSIKRQGSVRRPQPKPAEETAPPVKKSEQVEDPLNFIEIRSAAQWKAISGRISWKFDDCPEETEGVTEEEPSRTMRSLTKKKMGAVTLKAPEFDDLPSSLTVSSVSQLRNVCWRIKPWREKKERGLFTSIMGQGWGVDCDEVVAGLFIGDKAAASSVPFLRRQAITHVLNTAEGQDEGLVDLTSDDFFGTGVDYLGFTLWDSPICSILPYLGAASDFIERALKAEGRVMVCCQMGVSRSAACVLAYLMINREMDATSALGLLRRRRDVRPNDGFLEQLVALDTDLQLVRQLGREPTISLAFLEDLPSLPKPWNYEFYTKEVTEEEVGTPLVFLGEPCPLRLSGFSSLASTPLCSKSVSRRESRRSHASRFPSREPSFRQRRSRSRSPERSGGTSLCQSQVVEESGDDFVTGDELDDLCDGEEAEIVPIANLEQVREIIGSPEEKWRQLPGAQTEEERASTSALSEISGFSTTTKPHLIQQAADGDFLSLFKVDSAASWRALSKHLSFTLTEEDLAEPVKSKISNKVRPWDEPKDKRLFTSLFATAWGCDCDEVLPGLFIGDAASARNVRFLQKIGITAVLNTAEGPWSEWGFVDLSPSHYQGSGIHYQGFCLWDSPGTTIEPYFGPAAEYLDLVLSAPGGKVANISKNFCEKVKVLCQVLVNCQMGVSRSSTLALAFLMIKRKKNLLEALTELRRRRDIRPNDDFLAQLADLDNKLRRGRTEGGVHWKPRQLLELDKLPKPWHNEYWTDKGHLEGSSLPFTLRPMASSKPDLLLDGKVGLLQPPPNLPKHQKPVEQPRKQEEKSTPKFSFDQMVMAREKAMTSKEKSPPVETKKPGFKYSGSSTQLSRVTSLSNFAPGVNKKQEEVNGKKQVGGGVVKEDIIVKKEGANVKKENMVSTKENEIANNKPRSRSSSVESSSWEYYTETEPEDSD